MASDAFFRELSVNRRGFLAASTSCLLFASRGWSADEIVIRRPSLGDYPFKLGVASGDPNESGFVIWTRLAPKPLVGGGMPAVAVAVGWEVADDEQFAKVVKRGESIALPQLGHSVHVEVDGLEPARWYWYRFSVGDETSRVGRARTMPKLDDTTSPLRFAFASCQHFEAGLYTAYDHMAKEELDLVLHLGDYIYEGPGKPGAVRQHVGGKLDTLTDYRNRYAQYKEDEFLQVAHARFPWIVTWDDHEFENNYAGEVSADKNADLVAYLVRRANAYQAYYEHMPLRHGALPAGPHMRLHRRLRYGQLAEFNVLDTRQYRTDQPNDDGPKPLKDGVFDPNATMLGPEQEGWLCQGLLETTSRWNVLAQQVMMARVDLGPGPLAFYAMDQWPGYDVPRKRLLEFIDTRQVPNPIVLTGDIHSNWCSNLLVDFDDKEGKPVAVEFVGTSISSAGDRPPVPVFRDAVMNENPFVKFYNAQRGYVRCVVNHDRWQTDYQVVEFVTKPGAAISTLASFVVESGRPGVQKA